VTEFDHSDQSSVLDRGDREGQGLSPSELDSFFLHKLDRVVSVIGAREKVDTPSCGGVRGCLSDRLDIAVLRKPQDEPAGSDRQPGPSARGKFVWRTHAAN